jgi:hypothetical protein
VPMKAPTRRLSAIAAIVLVSMIASLVLVIPRSSDAEARLWFGANAATSVGLAKTQEIGFDWVRIYFPDQVQEAEALGLNILLLVGWQNPLTDVSSFGDEVYDLVSRFRGRVAAYQICNEPNLAEMWHKPQYAAPSEYVAYLREAYLRAKQADPNCTIVSAGLAVNGGAGRLAMDDVAFLRGMYDAGAKPYFDVLGSHPYGFGYAPEDATSNPIHCFRRVEQQRQVMVAYGDGSKPVWATEAGWIVEPPASCRDYPDWSSWWWQRVSLSTQAAYLVRAYRYAQGNWPWMQAMFMWNMDYNLASWNEFCNPIGWFAILNHDQTPRPAYGDLAQLARGEESPSQTPTPGTGSMAGTVLLQGRSAHAGVLISAGTRTVISIESGGFRIEGLAAGAYDVSATMPAYLRRVVSQVIINAGTETIVPQFVMRGGDVNADGEVSLADLVSVSLRYDSRVPPSTAEDVNGDGQVDLVDLVLVASNYGTSVTSQ